MSVSNAAQPQPTNLARYSMIRELGRRPGRRTVLAVDTATQQQVVVKQLTFGDELSWDDVKRFKREAKVLRSLNHPSVPDYLDFFEFEADERSGFALVQTYIDSPSLAQWREHQSFNEKDLHKLAQQLLKILQDLHQRRPSLIHRDIKPSNILWDGHRAYLVDFGAVQTLLAQPGATISVVGTYGYMAPEQFGGQALPASDLYGLGATLIYAATGKHPAELPQKELRVLFDAPQLSPGLCNWLRQLTAPSLGERCGSAKDALMFLNLIPAVAPVFYQMLKVRSLPPIPDESRLRARWGEDYLEIEIKGVRPSLRQERIAANNPLLRWLKRKKIDQATLYRGWVVYVFCLLISMQALIKATLSLPLPWNMILPSVALAPLVCLIARSYLRPFTLNRFRPQLEGGMDVSPNQPFTTRLVIDANQVTVFQCKHQGEGDAQPEELLYRLRRSLIWQVSQQSSPQHQIHLYIDNQILKLLCPYSQDAQWLNQVLCKVLELPLMPHSSG